MENTMQQISMLRNTLIALDNCEPAIDGVYDLSQVFYGEYHADYETLNDVIYTIKQSLFNRLCALENVVLTPIT
jgi:hypothetical protein